MTKPDASTVSVAPGLRIAALRPIRVMRGGRSPAAWSYPSLSTSEIFPTLWAILYKSHDDWVHEARRHSFATAQVEDPTLTSVAFRLQALDELKPLYIQCLFSYINTFFVLAGG